MPVYSYGCGKCGREEDAFRSIEARHDGPACCGAKMRIEIRPAYAQPDLPGYVSPVTGEWVDGRRARREDLKRTGSRPWEGMEAEKAEAARRRKESEAKFDRKLDEGIRRAYHQLPPEKRRILEGR